MRFGPQCSLGPDGVEYAAPRRRHQPALGVTRFTVGGPLGGRRREGLGEGILGEIGAAGPGDQPSQQPTPRLAVNPLEKPPPVHGYDMSATGVTWMS